MRTIGSLANETQARAFIEFLISKRIRNQLERESDGTFAIWVFDEDQIAEAQGHLARFQANPSSLEFLHANVEAQRVRQAEAEDLAKYRRRVRTRRSLFPKLGGYGVGAITYALIFICVAVAVYSKLGRDEEFLRHWFISDASNNATGFLPEVRAGEIWRLLTPMFVHFGPLHLIFNLLWLYHLGCMIEARQSSGFLLIFVAVSAACSNVAQYAFSGPGFGGMSGVVYALAGYAWIRGKLSPGAGIFLDPQNATIMFVWLILCFTGAMGPVANFAHVAGLIVGLIWGALAALVANKKPE